MCPGQRVKVKKWNEKKKRSRKVHHQGSEAFVSEKTTRSIDPHPLKNTTEDSQPVWTRHLWQFKASIDIVYKCLLVQIVHTRSPLTEGGNKAFLGIKLWGSVTCLEGT